jgi:hypothetical protein
MAKMDPPYMVLADQHYVQQTTPALGLPIVVIAGSDAKTVESCAQDCTDQPGCDFATWHALQPGWTSNVTCWLKQINRKNYNCSVVANADYQAGCYVLLRKTQDCALPPRAVTCGS